jgi:hypothetical protein
VRLRPPAHLHRARQALPPGSTVGAQPAAPTWPRPPAWRAGRSLATRPRAVTGVGRRKTGRGDQHPARIGARQRAAAAPAGRSPTTPVRAPRRPATGAARRAASAADRSTAAASCSTWSTAAGRWRRSWTACGGPRGRCGATAPPLPGRDGPVPPGPAGPPTGARRPQRRQGTVAGALVCRLADLPCLAHTPRGVVRPRRAVRFARSIHPHSRDLGEPLVRAACSGNPSLAWLPGRVVPA